MLYFDLYVLGDDALESQGSFMQTKYLRVVIHIWIKGEVGALLNRLKFSSKIFYWPFQGGTSFVDLLWVFFCLAFAMPLCVSVYMCLVVTCWEMADLLALVCGVLLWVCYFPIGILGQVCYLIVSIPDLCTLTYFLMRTNSICQWLMFVFGWAHCSSTWGVYLATTGCELRAIFFVSPQYVLFDCFTVMTPWIS